MLIQRQDTRPKYNVDGSVNKAKINKLSEKNNVV